MMSALIVGRAKAAMVAMIWPTSTTTSAGQ
jgi:hypothetical protein